MPHYTHTIRPIWAVVRQTFGFPLPPAGWSATPQPFGWPTPTGLVGRLFHTLLVWQERARSRRRLLTLDDHMLSDIGRSRAEAVREASKPFWKE